MMIIKVKVIIFIFHIIFFSIFDSMSLQLFVHQYLNMCQNIIFTIHRLHRNFPMSLSVSLINCNLTRQCQVLKILAYFESMKILILDSLKDLLIKIGGQISRENFQFVQKSLKHKLIKFSVSLQSLMKSIKCQFPPHDTQCIYLCDTPCLKQGQNLMVNFRIILSKIEHSSFMERYNFTKKTSTSEIYTHFSSIIMEQIESMVVIFTEKCCQQRKIKMIAFSDQHQHSYRVHLLESLPLVKRSLQSKMKKQFNQIYLNTKSVMQKQIQIQDLFEKIVDENQKYFKQQWGLLRNIQLKKRKNQFADYKFLDKNSDRGLTHLSKIFDKFDRVRSQNQKKGLNNDEVKMSLKKISKSLNQEN